MKNRINRNKISSYLIAVYFVLILSLCFLYIGCAKKKYSDAKLNTSAISLKKYDYPEGADPSVSAEMGGTGFTGEGWESSDKINVLNNEEVYKGGTVVFSFPNFPLTLRPFGKDFNNYFTKYCGILLYESLLQLDPITSEYNPLLATHWKISEDKQSFKFRINPKARWADGKPVVADDFIATWKLMVDEGILDPYTNQVLSSFEEPIAESKYIISVKSKNNSWRQFYYISSIPVLPAHIIKNISGKEFIENFQLKYITGTGPYAVLDSDIVKDQNIALRKRSDYWGEKELFNKGKYNFDVIKFIIAEQDFMALEKFKKREIDILQIGKISNWIEKFDFPEVKKGLVLKRKIYNQSPKGIVGICINTKKEPFTDVKVRKAFAYAFNRKRINESMLYGEYNLMNSYYAGTIYENPSNPVIGFNLDSAANLLSEAGWKEKNSEGYLVKNGKVFEVELPFLHGMDRFYVIYKEDLGKIGVKINLKEIDFATAFKVGSDKNFVLMPISWTGLIVPNPESNYSSNLSESKGNTNWSGISDKRIDDLIGKYNFEYDRRKRILLIRQIDSLLTENQIYILTWYGTSHRIIFHNLFKYPECMMERETGIESIMYLWSFDPEKVKKYNEALADEKIYLDTGICESKFWLQEK